MKVRQHNGGAVVFAYTMRHNSLELHMGELGCFGEQQKVLIISSLWVEELRIALKNVNAM